MRKFCCDQKFGDRGKRLSFLQETSWHPHYTLYLLEQVTGHYGRGNHTMSIPHPESENLVSSLFNQAFVKNSPAFLSISAAKQPLVEKIHASQSITSMLSWLPLSNRDFECIGIGTPEVIG